uniref:Uncharacterized protein n=1 Tax=Sphaerodactylus townsendi TaxID=933632 RepID=A0ACB8GE75_9SAUR
MLNFKLCYFGRVQYLTFYSGSVSPVYLPKEKTLAMEEMELLLLSLPPFFSLLSRGTSTRSVPLLTSERVSSSCNIHTIRSCVDNYICKHHICTGTEINIKPPCLEKTVWVFTCG